MSSILPIDNDDNNTCVCKNINMVTGDIVKLDRKRDGGDGGENEWRQSENVVERLFAAREWQDNG